MTKEEAVKARKPYLRDDNWLNRFLNEKEIDTKESIEVQGKSGMYYMTIGNVVEAIGLCPHEEKHKIKTAIAMIDFKNGNIKDYFNRLAKAIA